MKILLLGNTGQLGWELERTLATLGVVHAVDYPQLNLVDISGTSRLIHEVQPDLVINATAYTDVDRAESERELAEAINARGPALLAEETSRLGVPLIHFSTDYVFDGSKAEPYVETDSPHPIGVYGESKLAGEMAVQELGGAYLIFRTSWVYSLRRANFVTKVLRWSREQADFRLVTDQISNPTWSRMLAEVTGQLVAMAGKDLNRWMRDRSGLYHLAGWGYASRWEWGQEILALDAKKEEQLAREALPASTSDFPSLAKRPLFSALNCDLFFSTFGIRLPDWQQALKLAMNSIVTG